MIRARVTSIESQHRFGSHSLMSVGAGVVQQAYGTTDVELRIMLACDSSVGISYDALHLIEEAIEKALNEPLPPKQKAVPLDVALPPGPRKITL